MQSKYCTKCKRFLTTNNFYQRQDRPGRYAWCKGCMRKTPLQISVQVNEDWVQVIEKPERSYDFPLEIDRGYGVIH
jgi:hypothetical protein